MKNALLFVFAIFSFSNAIAQVITWDSRETKLNIAPTVSILEEPYEMSSYGISFPLAYNDEFHISGKPVLNFGFTKASYWLRFTLENYTNDSLLLELDQAFIPEARLYYKGRNGKWLIRQSGYKVPLNKKLVLDHRQVFPLPNGVHEFYIRITPFVHAVPVKLWSNTEWQLASTSTHLAYGIYAGVLLLVILISLLIYFILRKAYSIFYAILVALYIASSAAVMEGYAIYFFPDMDMMYWYRLIPVLNMPALLIFCVSFLQLKDISNSLYRFTLGVISILLVYTILLLPEHSYVPLIPNLVINQVLALFVFLLAISIGVATGKSGNQLGYYFAFSYLIWFCLLTVEIIYIQVGRPTHVLNISYVSIAIFTEALLLAYLVVHRIQTERLLYQRQQFEMQTRLTKIQQEYQEELLHAELEIQEQILDDISKELHDNISLSLVIVNMNLHMVNSTLSDNDAEKLQKSQDIVSKVLLELRQLSRSLNTDFIKDLGLINAIKQQIQIVKKTGVFDCELDLSGKEKQFPIQHELLIFRVIQELITNTIKHANASLLKITMRYYSARLVITVQDNGQGFDMNYINRQTSGGLGLRNMQNRIGLINGNFNMESKIGEGTITVIEIFDN